MSVDMAHGLHPNYTSKHDSTTAPKINNGLVIKSNSNQRYATNPVSASLFRRIGINSFYNFKFHSNSTELFSGKIAGVPVQEFTVRSDAGCGSTIGQLSAVDCLIELVIYFLYSLFRTFYCNFDWDTNS